LTLGDRIAILRDGEVIQQGTPADIVLKPADDYIAAFVKEVNRGRVIEVEAVMTAKMNGAAKPGLRIPAGTCVEAALREMSIGKVGAATVVSLEGADIGRVTTDNLIRCLVGEEAAPDEARPDPSAAAALSAIP
jgi:glycine betaine/proline transport system ATP-binding protein